MTDIDKILDEIESELDRDFKQHDIYLNNGQLKAYARRIGQAIKQYALSERIKLTEDLIRQTRQQTYVKAHISDIFVAKDIRVHTNSLLENVLSTLKRKQEGQDG